MFNYLERRVTGIFRFLKRVMASFAEHDCTKQAAALSYYALFSTFPLLLFLIYIASFFFPSEESRLTLSEYIRGFIPYGAEKLNNVVEQTWQARRSIGLVSGIALLWGGSSIFSILETSLSMIWDSSPRTFWRRRALGILSVLALVSTFLASFFISPFTNTLLERSGPGRQVVSYLLELSAVTIVLLLLYRIFPNETVKWEAAFSGGFSAAVLIIFARFVFRLYTSIVIARSGLLYGSLTWFLTFALWIYLVGVLALFGAEFAAAYQRRQEIIEGFLNA